VLPQVQYKDFRRGLCILDPYGLDLEWKLMATAGQTKSIDMFLNFPVMDMNRNVLWRNPEGVDAQQAARMSRYWGDESWRSIVYRGEGNLFGWLKKQSNKVVVEAFRNDSETWRALHEFPIRCP
jgi:three-Cys-motif partner protein